MHWADVIASSLATSSREHLISTGISPSGFIHVGSLREAITASAIRKALMTLGRHARLIYLVDSFDPLRKKYPFLPDDFEVEVGKPLSHIRCPCGEHKSYAHHFIQPFLDALELLGIKPEIFWTHELYANGSFAESIDNVINSREKIIEILKEVTKRDVSEDYYPYNPRCNACGKFADVEIIRYEKPYVFYKCPCGNEGKADIRKDDGKMPWRIEWVAKWKIFGVTCEPFGKDHAAAGGSYDTGIRFAREVFNIEPPYPVPYEFVQLKGKGQLHKSTGAVITGIDALRITPAPVLSFTMLRYNPDRHIDYDSGLGILDMVDEYDRIERLYYEGGAEEKELDLLRAYELAQPKFIRKKKPLQVPYRHLVNVVQIADSFDAIIEILKRTEHVSDISQMDAEMLWERVQCVRYWLEHFAPEEIKFSLLNETPQLEISNSEISFLTCLATALKGINWEADAIHNAIYGCIKTSGLTANATFQLLYQIFIGRKSGPRLGYFLSTLDKTFVLSRIEDLLRKSS
ncbi:MAG: lysine--tRNA ligase [Methanomassiliicoccales archaeon]